MKVTRLPARPQPTARAIKHFDRPAPAPPPPLRRPSGGSNEIAAYAVKIASTPGRIDPRQQRF